MTSIFPLLFSQEYAVECMIREAKEKAYKEAYEEAHEEGKIKAIIECIQYYSVDFEKIKASGLFSERIIQKVESKIAAL